MLDYMLKIVSQLEIRTIIYHQLQHLPCYVTQFTRKCSCISRFSLKVRANHVEINEHCIVEVEDDYNQHIYPKGACTFPSRSSAMVSSSHYNVVRLPSLSPEDQHLYTLNLTHAMWDSMVLSIRRKSVIPVEGCQVSTVSCRHSFPASSGRCR